MDNIFLDRSWENMDSTVRDTSFTTQYANFPNVCITGSISDEEIDKVIHGLCNRSSTESSDIQPEFLKALNAQNWWHLWGVFQNYMYEESVPSAALLSRMQLLFKSGSKADILNHWSVSLQCNILKVYTKVILDWLNLYVDHCKILGESQNGFSKNRIFFHINDIFPITMGVKQGCVMLPLLFSLFSADLSNLLKMSCVGAKLGEIFVHVCFLQMI